MTPLRKSLAWILLALLLGCSGGAATNFVNGGNPNFPGGGGPLDGPGAQLNGSAPVQPTHEGSLRPGLEVVLIKVTPPQRRGDFGGAVTGDNTMAMAMTTNSDTGSSSSGQETGTTTSNKFPARDGKMLNEFTDGVVVEKGPFSASQPLVMVTQASPLIIVDTPFNQKYFSDPQKTDAFGNAIVLLHYHPIGSECHEGAYTIWACWISPDGKFYQSQKNTYHCPDGSSEHPYGTKDGDYDPPLVLAEVPIPAGSTPPQCPNVLGVQAVEGGVMENSAD